MVTAGQGIDGLPEPVDVLRVQPTNDSYHLEALSGLGEHGQVGGLQYRVLVALFCHGCLPVGLWMKTAEM